MGFEHARAQEKCSGNPAREPGRMQQQNSGRPLSALLEGGQIQRALRHRLVGAGQQENAVSLAQALVGPGAVRRVAVIEHHVMRGLEGVEPFRGLFAGLVVEHRRAAAHFGQCIGQAVAMTDYSFWWRETLRVMSFSLPRSNIM